MLHYLILSLFFTQVVTPSSEIQGHWIQIVNAPEACPEEIIFKSNNEFAIFKECHEQDEITKMASGEYTIDDKELLFKNLMFTSFAGDFLTQEYTRIEWKVSTDTLTLEVFRDSPEIRTYLRN